MDIFCDGAASRNGSASARAGYGVAIYKDRKLLDALSSRLESSEAQTNQRAELQAMKRALEYVKANPSEVKVTIYSDSEYAIKCTSIWGTSWKKAGWRKKDNAPIQHLDIIQVMVPLYEELQPRVGLQHVRGHQKKGSGYEADGNNVADKLATDIIQY